MAEKTKVQTTWASFPPRALAEHMTNFQRKKCNVYIKKANEIYLYEFYFTQNEWRVKLSKFILKENASNGR